MFGSRFRVQGSGFKVRGSGFPNAEPNVNTNQAVRTEKFERLQSWYRPHVSNQSSGDDRAEPAGERRPRQHLHSARHRTVVEGGVTEDALAHDLDERHA